MSYPGFVRTSSLSRLAIAWTSASRALADPRRADDVAKLGEVTGRVALERLRESLRASPSLV